MGSCSATAGGLRLGSLGLESDALGSPSAQARDRDNQLLRGLGQRWVRADTARGTLDCLDLGDGRDSAVDGSCSRRRQLEEADRSSRTLLVRRSRTRAHMISLFVYYDYGPPLMTMDEAILATIVAGGRARFQ